MKKLLSVLLTLFIVFMSFNLILAEDYTYTSVQMSIRKDEKTIKNNLQCYLLTDTATNNNYQMYIPFEDFIESLGYEFKWVDIYYDYNGEQEEWTKYDGYIIINNTKYYFCYCNLYQDEINGNIDIYTYKNGELIDVNLDLYKSGGTILINDKIYIRQEAIAWLLQYEGYLTQIDLDNNCINIKSYDINNLIQYYRSYYNYDYSNVDAETLSKAAAIRYKMELFQKNENGTYDETKPLKIGSYLQNIVKDAKSDDISGNGDKAYQWKNDFVSDDTKHQFAQFTFTPLTGEKFEKEQYTYANYRVRLTAVLLDKNGSELDGTKATDYIIYTNARIYQDMIDNN